MNIQAPAVYTLDEVAAMMKASTRTIRRWIDAGKFPRPLPLPGQLRFRCHDIDALVGHPSVEVKHD